MLIFVPNSLLYEPLMLKICVCTLAHVLCGLVGEIVHQQSDGLCEKGVVETDAINL